MMKRFLLFCAVVGFFLSLSACTLVGDQQAPVVEGSGYSTTAFARVNSKPTGNYRVKRGDTLYSIAWANNMDYRTLAAMNRLDPPYRIYAGQYLRTRRNFFESLGQMFKRESVSNQTQVAQRAPIQPKAKPKKVKLAKTSSQRSQKKVSQRSERKASQPKKTVHSQSKKRYAARSTVKKIQPSSAKKGTSIKGWRWPAKGRVVERYSERPGGNKGIDIAGNHGDSVRAAASGKVVYSGSGLKGYGQLLLIKHNNSYLSAYAHNKRILVSEGDQVKIGQKIAEMGRMNHGAIRLHFEIRRNGKPIDPMIYLASARR